ncbi:MAG: hypothetical protein H6724_14570 [Sandaracinus sp.]|nr:hypothetical protein [Sandaracinus sp.]
MTVHAFVDSPLRRRSPVLGVLGALLALPAAFFVVMAIVDLADDVEDPTGPLLGGACMAAILALGVAAMVYGFGKTSKPRAVTRAAAQRARAVGLATLDTSAPDAQQINVAAGWMLDGRYEDAMRAYHQIAERFPGAPWHRRLANRCVLLLPRSLRRGDRLVRARAPARRRPADDAGQHRRSARGTSSMRQDNTAFFFGAYPRGDALPDGAHRSELATALRLAWTSTSH